MIDDDKKKEMDKMLVAGELPNLKTHLTFQSLESLKHEKMFTQQVVDHYAMLLAEDLNSTANTELHFPSDSVLQTAAKEGLWTLQVQSNKRYRYHI